MRMPNAVLQHIVAAVLQVSSLAGFCLATAALSGFLQNGSFRITLDMAIHRLITSHGGLLLPASAQVLIQPARKLKVGGSVLRPTMLGFLSLCVLLVFSEEDVSSICPCTVFSCSCPRLLFF